MTFPREPQQPARPHLPPAGWLPDPASIGVERYWDGSQWTQATRYVAGAEPRVPTPDPASGAIPQVRAARAYSSTDGWGGTAQGEWMRGTYSAPKPRRVGRGVTWLAALTVAVVLVTGYVGALPGWVPWPDALTAQTPTGPDVDYPVFGSTETVEFLARSMIAQQDSISLGFRPALSPDDASDAVMEAVTQNPHIFVREWAIRSSATGVTVEPVYLYSDEEAEQRRRATADAVMALVLESGAASAASEAEQVRLLHDAIARTARYDWVAADTIEAGANDGIRVNTSQEAYGILVEHTAVCTGYAEAMQLAADAMGIDAVVVTGVASSGITTGGHAWNLVNVDGEWLVVDVTWDDAAVGDTGAELLRHDYLLISQDSPLLSTRARDLDWIVDSNEGFYATP